MRQTESRRFADSVQAAPELIIFLFLLSHFSLSLVFSFNSSLPLPSSVCLRFLLFPLVVSNVVLSVFSFSVFLSFWPVSSHVSVLSLCSTQPDVISMATPPSPVQMQTQTAEGKKRADIFCSPHKTALVELRGFNTNGKTVTLTARN